jgi:lysophospholipase L1-like esterase
MAEQIRSDEFITFIAFFIGAVWLATVLGLLVIHKSRQWLISHRKEWILSGASLFVAFALMDVAMSYLGVVETVEHQRARSIAYTFGNYTKHRLVPKIILVEDGVAIPINTRGFRGQEINVDRKPGQIRILFLGGSQVFDFNGGDWPSMVGKELRRLEFNVETINAGVPGHTTFDSLGKLLTDIWTLKPQIIFLCQAWNDIKYFSWLSPNNPYRGLPPREPASWKKDWRLYPSGIDRLLSYSAFYRKFRWGFGQILYFEEGNQKNKSIRKIVAPATAKNWGPKQYRINLEMIATLSREIGAELAICKQAHQAVVGGTGPIQTVARDYGTRNTGLSHDELMRYFDITYNIIDDIALNRALQIFDMNEALSGRKDYFNDGIHFSPTGSRKASKLVAKKLAPMISRISATLDVQ